MEEKVTLVFGVGFTAEYIIRAITERGIKDVLDVAIFSVTSEEEFRKRQAQETMDSILKYLSAIGISGHPKYISIKEPFDFIVYQISDLLWTRNNLEFYIIGGMRILNLALYFYAILAKTLGKRVKAYSYTEDMSYKYELPVMIPAKPSDAEYEILEYLGSKYGEVYMNDIAKILNKSLPTISKQIDFLENQGYVECKETKPKPCKITDLGKVCLQTLRGLKSRMNEL
ncbi:CRISPR-associated transcriptional regulator Csa3 [Sulfurisphaera tokodaii]|uniref:DNA-binding protein n=2 Tax=Sulfurisphaera tokodaii TaxID=111955 RepID=Q970L3_SULTO|nr:CRISPR-associated transcriptional regulator Csa3 [Sulfurisphaera tokodaii]BAB66660.1 putative DNA-binding protein [Sulfurisphaera tokodaii str. 7]HII73520.1 CRISPR-associated transcriptional regulator Csa3 [Sulfurisphaera tokodaii]